MFYSLYSLISRIDLLRIFSALSVYGATSVLKWLRSVTKCPRMTIFLGGEKKKSVNNKTLKETEVA